jgi:hypothetical protein
MKSERARTLSREKFVGERSTSKDELLRRREWTMWRGTQVYETC